MFISDIAGQDVKPHNNDPLEAINLVRDWLNHASKRTSLPSGLSIWRRYQTFQADFLPRMINKRELDPNRLICNDYVTLITGWLRELKVSTESEFFEGGHSDG